MGVFVLVWVCVCVCVRACVCVENSEFPSAEPPVTRSTHLALSVRPMDIE